MNQHFELQPGQTPQNPLPDAAMPAREALSVAPQIRNESELRCELAERFKLDPEGPWDTSAMLHQTVADIWHKILNPENGEKTQYGSARRIVLLLSDNENKTTEYVRNLERYGIEVYRVPPIEHEAYKQALFQSPKEEIRVINLVREESNLYKHADGTPSTGAQLERVDNVSHLKAFKLVDGALQCSEYRHATEGYIDLNRRAGEQTKVFGWDDIFVMKGTGRTYQEMVEKGIKVSSRDMVISEYLQDQIYYTTPINLKFNPQQIKRPVDFSCSVREFVRTNPHLNNAVAVESGLSNLFAAVVNEGMFFRAPLNRREKNYWLPGLNAGLPFTPKKDEIHQITFAAHDFGHFLFPDLIFTGNNSPENRATYIAYRMMGEALTMVMADMLFVDTLKRNGTDYDFSKRKIYPLYQDLKLDFSDRDTFLDNLKTVLRANVDYCLRGRDGSYRELLTRAGSTTDNLAGYKDKYMPFFVEDYRWTDRNWDNMGRDCERQARWWKSVEPLRASGGLHLETIEEFHNAIKDKPGDLVERVFERLFETRIKPAFEGKVVMSPEEQVLGKACHRYMMGQLGLMAEFDFVPESRTYSDAIIGYLKECGPNMTVETVDRVRGFYEQFVDLLCERNVITLDDARTYKEVYPLYPPFYVFYDEEKGFYKDLADVAKGILGDQLRG